MIINYIYIDKYKGIEDFNLNFSNEVHFEFDRDNSTLSITKKDYFINDFYGSNIKNISAIIGENGTGKSTILDFINYELLFPKKLDEEGFNCILSTTDSKTNINNIIFIGYKKGNIKINNLYNVNVIKYNLKEFTKTNYDKENWKKGITALEATKQFSNTIFVKLSNSFDYSNNSEYGPKRNPILINLSTNFLLRYPNNEYPITTLNNDDLIKAINFIVDGEDDFLPKIKYPATIDINLKELGVKNFLMDRDFYGSNFISSEMPAEKLRENNHFIKQILLNFEAKFKVTKFKKRDYFEHIIAQYFFIDIIPYLNTEKTAELFGSNSATNLCDLIKVVQSRVQRNTYYFVENSRNRNRHIRFWGKYINDVLQYILSVDKLIELDESHKDDLRKITIRLNKSNKKALKANITASSHDILFSNILYFTWGNNLSSGEQALLYQYSRLYNFYKVIENTKIESVILLIDEGELYMHPSWQLKYMSVLIDFINRRFEKFNFQIILTSHSPFIISDLLKENVIFLRNENDKSIISSLDEMEQTFGSNIHLLFTDSFFMKDGTIGEFAQRKIEDLIDVLAYKDFNYILEKYPDIEKRISMIGEPIIRNKLTSMFQEKIPFGITELERRITILEKKNVSNSKGQK